MVVKYKKNKTEIKAGVGWFRDQILCAVQKSKFGVQDLCSQWGDITVYKVVIQCININE